MSRGLELARVSDLLPTARSPVCKPSRWRRPRLSMAGKSRAVVSAGVDNGRCMVAGSTPVAGASSPGRLIISGTRVGLPRGGSWVAPRMAPWRIPLQRRAPRGGTSGPRPPGLAPPPPWTTGSIAPRSHSRGWDGALLRCPGRSAGVGRAAAGSTWPGKCPLVESKLSKVPTRVHAAPARGACRRRASHCAVQTRWRGPAVASNPGRGVAQVGSPPS